MPIETICEGCARRLRVPDEHAGKKARCPQCGTIYIVPASSDHASSESKADRARDQNVEQDHVEQDHVEQDVEGSVDRWQLRTPDGHLYGPVPKEELDQWYAQGRIPPAAMVIREGERQWHVATEIYPRLADARNEAERSHNPFAEEPRSTPRHAVSPRRPLPHRGGTILVLALLGWFFCPIFAPIAWSMGSGDLRSIRLGQMDPSGESLTQAGMILGMLETILVVMVCVLVCLGVLG
ncbi:MAG: GYF domain-containing protein [Planctomycetota bacterium]